MLLTEILFLYSIDEKSKKIKMKNLSKLLSGALLYDLENEGLVTFHQTGKTYLKTKLILNKIGKIENPLLDEAINVIGPQKKNFSISHWLKIFPNLNLQKIIIDNLTLNKYILQNGRKFQILNQVKKEEINDQIINCILKNHKPDNKFKLFLMLICLRKVNWKLLPKEINFKDEKIKEKLKEYRDMLFEDKIGWHVGMQIPQIRFLIFLFREL